MAIPRQDASQKITDYISKLPQWSQTLCTQLRRIILDADASVVEDWKWGPNYASNGMICGIGAFQKHVKLTFYNGSAMKDSKGLFNHCVDNEFCRSIKYTDVKEINEKELAAYVRESAAINAKGFKRVVKDKTVIVPQDLQEALAEKKEALAFFDSLSYGYKKEFVELVTTAKQEKTRLERIAKVVSHCAEGRKLNDKYKKATG